ETRWRPTAITGTANGTGPLCATISAAERLPTSTERCAATAAIAVTTTVVTTTAVTTTAVIAMAAVTIVTAMATIATVDIKMAGRTAVRPGPMPQVARTMRSAG